MIPAACHPDLPFIYLLFYFIILQFDEIVSKRDFEKRDSEEAICCRYRRSLVARPSVIFLKQW